MVLVVSYVSRISVKDLTHLEDSGSLTVLAPKVLWNFWNGVNTDTIELEGIYEVLDPVLEVSTDPTISLVEIRKICESAVLNLPLIIPVVDWAVVMVVAGLVQWVNLAEIASNWSNVVGHNIYHHVDASAVAGIHEILQVLVRTEMGISFLPVSGPVTMVAWLHVVDDW